MKRKIKILIADDHAILRDGLTSMLSTDNSIEIVVEAGNGEEAIQKAKALSPEIILMDIMMPGMTGIEASKIITEENKNIRIIFLSMETNEKYITSAVKSGGMGYLPKDVCEEILFRAIKKVHKGEEFFDDKISKIIFNNFLKKSSSASNYLPVKGEELSQREVEVLKLIAEGTPNREISEKLFISIRTVDAHRSHIMKKLDLKSTADLVKYAIKNEYVEL